MGFLDRILKRHERASADNQRVIPPAPAVTAEQAKLNRDVMEAEMAASRKKREDAAANT